MDIEDMFEKEDNLKSQIEKRVLAELKAVKKRSVKILVMESLVAAAGFTVGALALVLGGTVGAGMAFGAAIIASACIFIDAKTMSNVNKMIKMTENGQAEQIPGKFRNSKLHQLSQAVEETIRVVKVEESKTFENKNNVKGLTQTNSQEN